MTENNTRFVIDTCVAKEWLESLPQEVIDRAFNSELIHEIKERLQISLTTDPED